MRVEDLQAKGSGWLIRLHEKGGKQHMMPCHHALAEALHAYITAAGIGDDKNNGKTAPGRGLPKHRLHQPRRRLRLLRPTQTLRSPEGHESPH